MPWTLKYSHILGNWKHVTLFLISMWLITVIGLYTNIIIHGTFTLSYSITLACSLFLSIIIVLILIHFTKNIHDSYLEIKSEFKRISIAFLIGATMIIPFLIFYDPMSPIRAISTFAIVNYTLLLMSYISVSKVRLCINDKVKYSNNSAQSTYTDGPSKAKAKGHGVLSTVGSRSHLSISHTFRNSESEFRFVLSTKKGFELFAQHCISEFNIEGLLFLLEYCQMVAIFRQFRYVGINCFVIITFFYFVVLF